MKLSSREIALIADIQKSRRQRRTGAFVFVLFIPIWWYAMPLIGIGPDIAPLVIGLLLGYGVAYLVNVYFGVRPDDKLIDLLQRYVNEDAEALRQLSGRSKVGRAA